MFEIPKNKHLPKESFYVYFILRILRTFGFFDLKVFKFLSFQVYIHLNRVGSGLKGYRKYKIVIMNNNYKRQGTRVHIKHK